MVVLEKLCLSVSMIRGMTSVTFISMIHIKAKRRGVVVLTYKGVHGGAMYIKI